MEPEGRSFDPGESEGSALPGRAREAAERARERTLETVDRSSERVHAAVGETKHDIVDQIRRVSDALRSGAESEEGEKPVSRYTRKAGERIERAAEYLDETEPEDWIRDVENYARRNPAIFCTGALMLGLVAGRFLRSSAARSEIGRERERRIE